MSEHEIKVTEVFEILEEGIDPSNMEVRITVLKGGFPKLKDVYALQEDQNQKYQCSGKSIGISVANYEAKSTVLFFQKLEDSRDLKKGDYLKLETSQN